MFKKMDVQSLASVPNAAFLVRRTTGPGETVFPADLGLGV